MNENNQSNVVSIFIVYLLLLSAYSSTFNFLILRQLTLTYFHRSCLHVNFRTSSFTLVWRTMNRNTMVTTNLKQNYQIPDSRTRERKEVEDDGICIFSFYFRAQ